MQNPQHFDVEPTRAIVKRDWTAISPRRAMAQRSEDSLALLSDFLTECKHRGLAEATLVRYSRIGKGFFQHCPGLRPHEIKPHDVREYLAWLAGRGMTEHSLQQTLSALRSLFRFAEAFEIVPVSPARSIQQRRYRRSVPHPLSEQQVDQLIEAAPTLRDRALLEFFYSSGCRVAEVSDARLEDVNWSTRTVRVIGKGDKERLVPLSPRAVEFLSKYLGGRTEGWLFQAEGKPDQRGRVVRYSQTGQWLGVWCIDYHLESEPRYPKGRLKCRHKTVVLGGVEEMSREQARQKLNKLLAGKLPPRPRPVQPKPMTPDGIRQAIYKLGRAAGLGRVHPHILRHTFATHLLNHGADLLTIASFLGHCSISTTQIYAHVSQTKMRETLQRCHPHWKEAASIGGK